MDVCTHTAGVLALLSSTEHVVLDAPRSGRSVRLLAHLVVPDADCNLLQDVGLRPVLLETAPADHCGSLVGQLRAALLGQADRPDVGQLGHFVL